MNLEKQRILFIDSAHPSLSEELEKIGYKCDLNYDLSREEIKNTIQKYEGVVIRSKIIIDKEIIDSATHLKFIARVGAGMENIDVAYAEKNGIVCLHAPEGNRDAVAEQAVGMLLSLFNNLCRANTEVRKGKWIREGNRGVELMGKTVGIVGYGNMGSAFGQRLKGFGVNILVYDKYKKVEQNDFIHQIELDEFFEKTEVLSLHIPLTQETEFMVNEQWLSKFKKNIYLINTARGKVLKTSALVEGLKNGKILGACLDVLEYEDTSFEGIQKEILSNANSDLNYLIASDKVILTPHIAGWTHESNVKLAQVLAEKIAKLKL